MNLADFVELCLAAISIQQTFAAPCKKCHFLGEVCQYYTIYETAFS